MWHQLKMAFVGVSVSLAIYKTLSQVEIQINWLKNEANCKKGNNNNSHRGKIASQNRHQWCTICVYIATDERCTSEHVKKADTVRICVCPVKHPQAGCKPSTPSCCHGGCPTMHCAFSTMHCPFHLQTGYEEHSLLRAEIAFSVEKGWKLQATVTIQNPI